MEKLYSSIADNINRIRQEIGDAATKAGRDASSVRLMAVTKTVLPALVNAAIAQGVDLLGENKAQELLVKFDDYNKDRAEIHFIGHLQSNKADKIIDKVSMIHSVDRISLASEIHKQAAKIGKIMQVLIEVNIGNEASKSGVTPLKLPDLLEEIAQFGNIRIKGLMTIPPVCDSDVQIERYFCAMQQLQVDMQAKKIDNVDMDILSMGMSGDFIPAIKHGANIIRIGTGIFGTRQ